MADAAILLLAHGTPETLDDIPEYLRNVTSGRAMPEHVVAEIRDRYGLIGGSPLTQLTEEQGRLLNETMGVPVYVGMRNWKPYIVDVVKQMRADGVRSAVAICLAPQNSRTSVGLYRRAVQAEAGELAIDFVDGWADHPLAGGCLSRIGCVLCGTSFARRRALRFRCCLRRTVCRAEQSRCSHLRRENGRREDRKTLSRILIRRKRSARLRWWLNGLTD